MSMDSKKAPAFLLFFSPFFLLITSLAVLLLANGGVSSSERRAGAFPSLKPILGNISGPLRLGESSFLRDTRFFPAQGFGPARIPERRDDEYAFILYYIRFAAPYSLPNQAKTAEFFHLGDGMK